MYTNKDLINWIMIEKRVVLRNTTLNYIAPIAQNETFVQFEIVQNAKVKIVYKIFKK